MSEEILIVDDEPSNRKILAQELIHHGYATEFAKDGSEALRKLESSRPDLIILDDMMPGLSSLDVLRELHKREHDIPVVVEPTPSSLFIQILPPCSPTNFRHRVSPSPVPSTFLSPVPTWWNSSNTAS